MKHFKVDSVMVTTLKGQKTKVPLSTNRLYELSDPQRDQSLDLAWCAFWSEIWIQQKRINYISTYKSGGKIFFPSRERTLFLNLKPKS